MDPAIIGGETVLFSGENIIGVELEDGRAIGVSPVGKARIVYDGLSGFVAVSISGGAYGAMGPASAVTGWKRVGTLVSLQNPADIVSTGILWADGSARFGAYAVNVLPSDFAHSGVKHLVAGDCQAIEFVFGATSIDDAPVELTSDGGAPSTGNRLFVPLGHGYRFRIAGSCICTAGPLIGKYFSVEIKAAIKNISGTVSIVGTTTYDKTCSDTEMTETSLLVLADDVIKCLSLIGISLPGGNTYHWAAVLHTVDNA